MKEGEWKEWKGKRERKSEGRRKVGRPTEIILAKQMPKTMLALDRPTLTKHSH